MWNAFAQSQYERVNERYASDVIDEYHFNHVAPVFCRKLFGEVVPNHVREDQCSSSTHDRGHDGVQAVGGALVYGGLLFPHSSRLLR